MRRSKLPVAEGDCPNRCWASSKVKCVLPSATKSSTSLKGNGRCYFLKERCTICARMPVRTSCPHVCTRRVTVPRQKDLKILFFSVLPCVSVAKDFWILFFRVLPWIPWPLISCFDLFFRVLTWLIISTLSAINKTVSSCLVDTATSSRQTATTSHRHSRDDAAGTVPAFTYKHIRTYTPTVNSEWRDCHEQYSLVCCGA